VLVTVVFTPKLLVLLTYTVGAIGKLQGLSGSEIVDIKNSFNNGVNVDVGVAVGVGVPVFVGVFVGV
jgi:hypothetical protein